MSDIVERLRHRRELINYGHGNVADVPDADCIEAADEIERLRRWKALDKPLTAAMGIARFEIEKLQAENEQLRARLALAEKSIEILDERLQAARCGQR